jgi:hypothetical protein
MNEIDILKDNVNILQNELNIAHKRIAELREIVDVTSILNKYLINNEASPESEFIRRSRKTTSFRAWI